MGLMPIAEYGVRYNAFRAMPLFYMNDFSILGLRVPKIEDAVKALEADGYAVEATSLCARIRFDTRHTMAGIFEALSRKRIHYHMADLVDEAYQG